MNVRHLDRARQAERIDHDGSDVFRLNQALRTVGATFLTVQLLLQWTRCAS